MKLTIDKAALGKPLAAINRIIEKRNTIPVLSNVLLRAEGGRLALTGTDMDLQATASVAADVSTPGAITVPAATLHDIVRKLPDGAAITIETQAEGTQVAVRAGRSRFTLQALPESDYPDIAAGEFSHRFDLPAKTLAAIIASTAFAISSEETRYYLNGIHLHALDVDGEPRLRAVATDGHRLARIEIEAPAGTAGMPGIIVPRKTVGELAKLAEAGAETVTVEVSQTKIRVTAGDTVLTSKLIDGTFPDYQRVIPAGNDKRLTIERADLAAAVDRVATISSERGRAVKLALGADKLTLSVQNPDAGSASEELEASYTAAPLEIGFNARYVGDCLGVIDDSVVTISLADPASPALIEPREATGLLLVLMPMRV